jgi:hypothetical protein
LLVFHPPIAGWFFIITIAIPKDFTLIPTFCHACPRKMLRTKAADVIIFPGINHGFLYLCPFKVPSQSQKAMNPSRHCQSGGSFLKGGCQGGPPAWHDLENHWWTVSRRNMLKKNGGFHKWRYPKMDGFIRENPIKMDHLGVPNLWKPSNVEEAKMKMLMESDGNFQCLICNHVKAKI